VKSSSLPIIIKKERNHFPKAGTSLKLSAGPKTPLKFIIPI